MHGDWERATLAANGHPGRQHIGSSVTSGVLGMAIFLILRNFRIRRIIQPPDSPPVLVSLAMNPLRELTLAMIEFRFGFRMSS
jgi:hypothetical protein